MRTFSVISIIISCWLTVGYTGVAAESRANWATEAYRQNCESIVFIQGDKVEENRGSIPDSERTSNGMGTGVIIDEKGYIITNYHVVKDIRKIRVTTYAENEKDRKEYIAALVAKDNEADLAVIKINTRQPLKPITLGRSHDLMPGEACLAIGNPYGYAFSLTDGRIGAINRDVSIPDISQVYRLTIQTTAGINPGNSGGPLLNVNGEMIGINVATRTGATGISFAIPVDQIVEVAAKLIGEIVDQQITHGIKVSQIEPSNYEKMKRFYICVDSVESNSPAALAGIQKGDFLTGIGPLSIRNKLDFNRALLALNANEEIAFTYFRNNQITDVAVAVKGKSRADSLAYENIAPKTASAAPRTASNVVSNSERDKAVWDNFGIRYAPIPAQEYKRMFPKFTIASKSDFSYGGVAVKDVREGSPAAQASLVAGDIILGIEEWATVSANDIQWIGEQEWTELQSKKTCLRADIIRDNKHYTTDIPLK
jgi:serine protease Do